MTEKVFVNSASGSVHFGKKTVQSRRQSGVAGACMVSVHTKQLWTQWQLLVLTRHHFD